MNVEKNEVTAPEEIRKAIVNLLHVYFGYFDNIEFNDKDYNFFGLHGVLGPRELTYLTYMLEMRYDIQFNMKEYDEPEFYSLNGLSEIIARMLTEKY